MSLKNTDTNNNSLLSLLCSQETGKRGTGELTGQFVVADGNLLAGTAATDERKRVVGRFLHLTNLSGTHSR